MSEVSHNHELARRLAVLEERMKTMDERYDKGWALLREDMAKRDAEAAKRDKDNLRWQIGLWVAAVVIIGVILRWPVLPVASGS